MKTHPIMLNKRFLCYILRENSFLISDFDFKTIFLIVNDVFFRKKRQLKINKIVQILSLNLNFYN